MTTFSIILPTFNRSQYLQRAINSVLNQSYSNWELVIVNDGSTDDTDALLRAYQNDPKIIIVNSDHVGCASSRNLGLSLSQGTYITYLDDDNYYDPNYLQIIIDHLQSQPEKLTAYGYLASKEHDKKSVNREFDRTKLLHFNYIDMNVFVHHRSLYLSLGGMDERLTRLIDYELVLRYTENHKPLYISKAIVHYERVPGDAISKQAMLYSNWALIRNLYPRHQVKNLKVLYPIWQYPQLSESYIESEIQQMIRWGCEIHIWREVVPQSPYLSQVPIHDGTLDSCIERIKPDIIHIHWANYVLNHARLYYRYKIPVTLRVHGFETTTALLKKLSVKKFLKAIYVFPQHRKAIKHPKIKVLPSTFSTKLYGPYALKDPKKVIRTGPALPSKDIHFFIDLAKICPEFEFSLVLATCSNMQSYAQQILDYANKVQSPCKIYRDVPHDVAAHMVKEASIYLHTTNLPNMANTTPIGMPISIAEAMATGSYVLHRDFQEFCDYVGNCGSAYSDLIDAKQKLYETLTWTDSYRQLRWQESIERAHRYHADVFNFEVLLNDWLRFQSESNQPHINKLNAWLGKLIKLIKR